MFIYIKMSLKFYICYMLIILIIFDGNYCPAQPETKALRKHGIIELNGSSGGKSEFMTNERGDPVLSLAY